MMRWNRCLSLVLVLLFAAGSTAAAVDLTAMLREAKPGTTVMLPAGTFAGGDLAVPAGVSVRGAGYAQTMIDATRHQVGMRIQGGEGTTISDLTIRGATAAGLQVSTTVRVAVSRTRVFDCGVGLQVDAVRDARFENLVLTGNGTGAVIGRSTRFALANCTLTDNRDMSLSLTGNQHGAVFNNLFVNSQIGVYCGTGNTELAIDHNLYVALFVGGMAGEPARESLAAWRDLTGVDRHSVELPVQFADVTNRDFRPVLALTWSANRTTTADWGAPTLAGVPAPLTDINGALRQGPVDLGAYETALVPACPPDGTFTVASGEGTTSAGLFKPGGTLIAYLFHNLPLAKGAHPFWLPTRDAVGQPIPAGKYEIRTAESRLSLEYITLAANGGVGSDVRNCASIHPQGVTFDNDGHVILIQGGHENLIHIRAFDREFATPRWLVSGGGSCQGAVVDASNTFYRLSNGEILKAEAATGVIDVNGKRELFRRQIGGVLSNQVHGMTALANRLFVADPLRNRLLFADAQALDFNDANSWPVPRPRSPAADRIHNLIWAISGEDRLLALDPITGATCHTARPVAKPSSLAVCGTRLAVLSAVTRQVHVFDCSDPANLKPLYVIGSGHDVKAPGPIDPTSLTGQGQIAIDPDGRIAVVDGDISHAGVVRLFGRDGALLRHHAPFWGQFTPGGYWVDTKGKPEFHLGGANRENTVVLDPVTRTWRMGVSYAVPPGTPQRLVCLFNEEGRNFGVFSGDQGDLDYRNKFHVLRFDDYTGVLVRNWVAGAGGFMETAGGQTLPLETPGGRRIGSLAFKQDGRLFANGCLVPRVGLTPDGAPKWDWTGVTPKVSPFGEGGGGQGQFNFDVLPNGAWLRDEGNFGRGFGGGFTTFAAYNPDGALRWRRFEDHHATLGSLHSLRVFPRTGNALITAMMVEELDVVALDQDGLGLGDLGVPRAMNWNGFWHDQDFSMQGFTGPDGQPFLTLGDYTSQGYHWFAINGWQDIRHATVPVVVDDSRTQSLAAAPPTPPWKSPAPPQPRVLVRKLDKPLPVDGDCAKWRALGIAPQIMILPAMTTPDDCSALIRMAWQAGDLYVQVIKFDNVVSFHQPRKFFYKQDAVELSLIGGFISGYKFACTRTIDQGDVLLREQFLNVTERDSLDPAVAPRAIKVLDYAKDIPERAQIEETTGVDLAKSKVIITEFKLPMQAVWENKLPIKMESGAEFWFGFFIDDNDAPGTDIQKAYAWPVTYAAFGTPEQGARAVLE